MRNLPATYLSKSTVRNLLCVPLIIVAAAGAAYAQDREVFTTGPLLEEYGPVAAVDGAEAVPADAVFKVSFDVVEAAEPGELNRSFVSAARFLNMHVAAGVSPENISLALVVHGKAVQDVLTSAQYTEKLGSDNANEKLVAELVRHGVDIKVCGQSATYYGVSAGDLAPGVDMALSAMTVHAFLQRDGYTLNPF